MTYYMSARHNGRGCERSHTKGTVKGTVSAHNARYILNMVTTTYAVGALGWGGGGGRGKKSKMKGAFVSILLILWVYPITHHNTAFTAFILWGGLRF